MASEAGSGTAAGVEPVVSRVQLPECDPPSELLLMVIWKLVFASAVLFPLYDPLVPGVNVPVKTSCRLN